MSLIGGGRGKRRDEKAEFAERQLSNQHELKRQRGQTRAW